MNDNTSGGIERDSLSAVSPCWAPTQPSTFLALSESLSNPQENPMTLFFDEILPRLQKRILRVPPDDHWIWTGAKSCPAVGIAAPRLRRDRAFLPLRSSSPTRVKPYARFKHKGKKVYVHRFLAGAEEKQRMENFCGHTLCVNPAHWTPVTNPIDDSKPFFDPETEVSDCKNVIDGIGNPNFLILSDLLSHPLLVDYSHDAIKQALEELQ